jgi:hypothetical protein
MALPRVPTESSNEKQHRTVISTMLNELMKLQQTRPAIDAVEQFGLNGDGVTDNSSAFAHMFNTSGQALHIKKGHYKTGKFSIPSDTYVYIEPGTVIQDTGALGVNDRFLNINSVQNVHIVGWGAQLLCPGYGTGEQRHGCFIWRSQRIRVEGLECSTFGGDGFYVGGDAEVGEDDWPEDVHIVGCVSEASRRNGVSVVQGRNVWFIGHRSSNTSGTSPQKGYDVEPNESDNTPGTIRGVLENIHFLDCTSESNTGVGFSFAGANDTANTPISVFFENCYDNGSAVNFQTENSINNSGLISWKNCFGVNANTSGYEHKSCGMRTDIDGMTILDANQGALTAERNASSFSVYSANGTDGTTYGRLRARNCYALGTDAVKAVCIDLVSEATSVIRDVDIEVWSDRAVTKGCFYGVAASNLAGLVRVKFTDETEFASTVNLGTSSVPNYLNELLTNEGATGNVTHSIDDTTTRLPGVRIKARCKETQLFSLNPGTGWTIGGRSALRTRKDGAEVTVESDGVSNWRIVEGGDGWFGDEIDFSANDATPSVAAGTVFRTANTLATTITAFDDATRGKEIIVFIGDANTTIDFTGTTLKGNGGADWSPSSGDFLRGIFDGTNWRCSVHRLTSGALEVATQSANADTSGAVLADLETEVNELKAVLRIFGLIAT